MRSNVDDAVLESFNPFNGELVGSVRISTQEEIVARVAEARRAFLDWSRLTVEQRLQYIARFQEIVAAEKNAIARLITRETGKPLVESLGMEIFGVLETGAWLQANAATILQPESAQLNPFFFHGKSAYTMHQPLGVIAVISPWNFPFSIPLDAILSALAAGNAVVLKPSPKTPIVARLIGELFEKAKFPRGLVSVVYGDKVEAAALVQSDVDRVVFTGSVGGGKAIMELAAKKLHPLTLELGGKHPAIVLADVDIERTARALVWSAFANTGQACAAIERAYVVRSIVEKLTKRVVELTKELHLGDGLLPETEIGPMIDLQQVAHVQAQVEDAVANGAVVLTGGRARPDLKGSLPNSPHLLRRDRPDLAGSFFEPTVLSNVNQNMRIVREETFGPVLPIIAVEDGDEAVRLANDSHLGLGASVWSADLQEAKRLADRIEAGMVWINDAMYSHAAPDTMWGGIKFSGFGRKGGAAGLLDFTYPKFVSEANQGVRDYYFPYGQAKADLISGGLDVCHGRNLICKAVSLIKLIPTWIKTRFRG